MFNLKPTPRDLSADPDWSPPSDPVFQYLLQEALYGALPTYFAAVPLRCIRRFEPQFQPENTRNGDLVVKQIMEAWRRGEFKAIWLYPKGDGFICADDYFTLAAAEKGVPDFIPAWVLGPLGDVGAKDIQGPVDPGHLRKILGVN